MIRVNQIKMPLNHTIEDVLHKTAKILKIEPGGIESFRIVKKSVDARKKPDIVMIYSVEVSVASQDRVLARCRSGQVQAAAETKYHFRVSGQTPMEHRPVIIGTGPAGLFCGYMLAKHGYRPILLERGRCVEQRRADVERFWEDGVLDPSSNVQFGEGGAGTFSDGKLNTLVKDKCGRNKEVLRIFVEAGAPEEILYESKPHIGTDILLAVVRRLREQIIAWGGELRFEAQVTDLLIECGQVKGVVINREQTLSCGVLALAIGHSARDTFQMLYDRQIPMEAKAFAVGLRIEHPAAMIDQIQYGRERQPYLPAASYKVTAQTAEGRGVYSFCMCPGGYVVNASSEAGRLAVNGMSYSGRDGTNSNSAMIVTVTPEDYREYGGDGPLCGIAFQRALEERAYQLGQGAVLVERYGAFREAVTGLLPKPSVIQAQYPDFRPAIKGAYREGRVHEILPEVLNRALVEGIDLIGQNVKGFDDSGAYLSGVESRTSSPVRIHRDDSGQSLLRGLYPCGEGAGYAGGITSAAMDGILTAEKIAAAYAPFTTGQRHRQDCSNGQKEELDANV